MTTVYRDVNGNIFETEEECTKSENKILGIKMFDRNGDETFIGDDAFYIYCPNAKCVEILEDTSSTNKFNRNLCEDDYCEDSWWYWDERHNQFEKVDSMIVSLIRNNPNH